MVDIIKIEDSPSPAPTTTALPGPTEEALAASSPTAPPPPPPAAATGPAQPPPDPKDPEGFLSRCSGHNKRTGQRCAAPVGAKTSLHARNSHATFLPTCRTHREQQSFAGWCQFTDPGGERCGRLFRWTPPHFQLCENHIEHHDTPCYFFRLPTEIRQEIFSYLLPCGPIGSSSAPGHLCPTPLSSFIVTTGQQPLVGPPPHPPLPPISTIIQHRKRPLKGRASGPPGAQPNCNARTRICDLFLVSRQVYLEAKEILYSTVSFTIDIRKDGTFMCGRRLLEPKKPDGKPHYELDSAEALSKRFISTFDFASVKNYNVHVLVENESSTSMLGFWDEEVEIYDIRDYVSVAVSGILSKARELCKLNIRVALSKFNWAEDQWLLNIEQLIGPLKKLQNVRQPRFLGVWEGTTSTPWMISVGRMSSQSSDYGPWRTAQLCSVPSLPTRTMLFGPDHIGFDAYRKGLEEAMSQPATQQSHKPPIRAMFTEFKQFYAKLFAVVPDIQRAGRHAFLHRARVAREDGNVKAFRELRNEVILYWNMYLEREEEKKEDMNKKLCQMLDADTYPSSETELEFSSDHLNAHSSSPVSLDIDGMANDGIPMQSNYTPHRKPMPIQSHITPNPQAILQQMSQWAPPRGPGGNMPPLPTLQQPQQYIVSSAQQQMQIQAAAQILSMQQSSLNTPFPSTSNGDFSSSSSSSSSSSTRPPVHSQIRNHPFYPFLGSDFSSTSPTTNLPDIIDIPDDYEPLLTTASASSSISSASGRAHSARNHSISSASTTATTVDLTGWGENGGGFEGEGQTLMDSETTYSNAPAYSEPFAKVPLFAPGPRGVDEGVESERPVKRQRLNTGIRDCVFGDVKGKGRAEVIELD